MKNKIIILFVALIGFSAFGFTAGMSSVDAKELLTLVNTEKDLTDGLALIENSDNIVELSSDKEIIQLAKSLSEKYNLAIPDWMIVSNSTEAVNETVSKSNVDNSGKTKEESKSLWIIFFLSFAAGFAALLTPCVFPMIPMTVSFFTKQSKSKAEGIRNAIIFGISIIVIFTLLGTVVTWAFGSDALNAMSTNVWFNLVFFVLLIVFAVSFLGAFEIRLPNSWLNKADSKADKGGLIGIFFMALALALVSFSCTGPIVGSLLVQSATLGGIAPALGMFGFSLALALPFTLFAAFPGWMNSLPKSGGWLNTVKVVLGFLELALAFKFLSNADLVVQGHYLEREMFLAIWIGIFGVLAIYLFGKITLPHDDKVERLSVGRALFGTVVVIFVIYLIPGLWGAPLKLISGFPPPMSYSESPSGFGGGGGSISHSSAEVSEDMHRGEHGIMLFHDYDKGIAYANKIGKPVLLDFTGYACVNCRRMESNVWGDPTVLNILKDEVVMISLYVDDKTELPIEEQKTVQVTEDITRELETYGNKWSHIQATRYQTNSQPYYRMLGPENEDLTNGSADYQNHGNPEAFKKWLDEGLKLFKEAK
ncbi:MAG TPA: thiol:disulfide interchange protein [Crocinitomicaceae bacterium]|nr:thiol:disulfide interchange protein [Crocinitomicaceae bacterium]